MPCFCGASGMVHETGEATERFLRSVASGDLDRRAALDRQASHALAKINAAPLKYTDSCRMAGLAMSEEIVAQVGLYGCRAISWEQENARVIAAPFGE